MTFQTIISFLPWIVFAIIPCNNMVELSYAVVVCLFLELVGDYKQLRKGFILSWGTLIFFAFNVIFVTWLKYVWIATHMGVFASAALAAIAWFSLLIGKPFTIQYAKEKTPKDRWNSPVFIRINKIMTIFWGCLFIFNTEVNVLKFYYSGIPNWVYSVVLIFSMAVGMMFVIRFPDWYKARATQEPKNN